MLKKMHNIFRLPFLALLLPHAVQAGNPALALVDHANQVLMLVIVVLLGILAFKYKDRVIFLFTGDDRLHGNTLDGIWWGCARCFGACDGTWSIHVFGFNVKKKIGQSLGLVSIPLKISNIRAGDLPFKGGATGDFYLMCECGSHPPMITSVQENASPKVITFPEELVLRIRDSQMEDKVRFVVKEENFFGSEEVAELVISASDVFNLIYDHEANHPGKPIIKRFKMEPSDRNNDYETPAWLILEFSQDFDSALRKVSEEPAHRATVTLMDRGTGIYRDYDPSELKEQPEFQLIDTQGRAVTEPAEHMLQEIRAMRSKFRFRRRIVAATIILIIVGYAGLRFYVWSCYRQFKVLEMGVLSDKKFPMTAAEMKELRQDCSTMTTPECEPSEDQVLQTCMAPPVGQARPRAFHQLWHDLLGLDVSAALTLPCFHGVCKLRSKLAEYDFQAVLIVVGLIFGAVLYNDIVKQQMRNKQHEMVTAMSPGHSPMNRMQQSMVVNSYGGGLDGYGGYAGGPETSKTNQKVVYSPVLQQQMAAAQRNPGSTPFLPPAGGGAYN
ncbi:unnamed protein product [Amoebophrya sp. A120]|nr:unnamed protein product [Amoebophrya sp. A120]|eukprot:GSA120T00000016001.1